MYYILTYVSIIKKIIFLATPGPPWLRPDPPGYTWPPQATAYILEDASFNTYVLHTYISIYYKENHFFGHTRTPLATPGPPWLHLAPRLLHTYWMMPPLIHMYYILIYVSIIKKIIFFGHTRTPLATPGPPWLHLAPPGYSIHIGGCLL